MGGVGWGLNLVASVMDAVSRAQAESVRRQAWVAGCCQMLGLPLDGL